MTTPATNTATCRVLTCDFTALEDGKCVQHGVGPGRGSAGAVVIADNAGDRCTYCDSEIYVGDEVVPLDGGQAHAHHQTRTGAMR